MKLGIRLDCNTNVGFGHAFRCARLAKEMSEHIPTEIVVYTHDHANTQRIFWQHGLSVKTRSPHSEEESNKLKKTRGALLDWMIIDNYGVTQAEEEKFYSISDNILVIDDHKDRAHTCDIFLNPNYQMEEEPFFQINCKKKLRGLRFLPLPSQYKNMDIDRNYDDEHLLHISVFLGYEKQAELVRTICNSILETVESGMTCSVIYDEINWPHLGLADSHEQLQILPLQRHLGTILANSDISIGAGGSTVWERLFFRVPSIIIPTAQNQVPHIKNLEMNEFILSPIRDNNLCMSRFETYLRSLLLSSKKRNAMRLKMEGLIDGLGSHRVVNEMLSL